MLYYYFPVLKAQQKDSRKYSIVLSYYFTITILCQKLHQKQKLIP